MKYLSINTVLQSFDGCRNKTQNKFWGMVSIIKAIGEKIIPAKKYSFSVEKVQTYLEELFRLEDVKKTYSTSNMWSIVFSTYWIDFVPEQMFSSKPNIYDVAAWFYRRTALDDNTLPEEIVGRFIDLLNISRKDAEKWFSFQRVSYNFETQLYSESDLMNSILQKLSLSTPSPNHKTIAFENNTFLQSHPGSLGQAPFVQTLYANQGLQKCLILTQFDFQDFYPVANKTVSTIYNMDNSQFQQIFYGAPGTGKSFKIKKCTQGDDTVIRTTFHPDSDYSTFVGTYKPIMGESKPIYGFDATGNTVMVKDATGKIVTEQKIEYKFVQQAFTKAYIRAWKKMSMYKPMNMTFNMGSDKYVIIGIDDESIKVGKVGDDNTKAKEGADDITIKKSELNDSNDNKIEQQNNNEQNSGNEIKQTNDDTAPKPEVDDNSENKEKIIKEIKGKIKEIDTNSFDEAWNKLKNGFINPQFLIIEEINRGNCAQIFGDLFQLLDRKEGYSEYPIESDEDLRKELKKEFDGLKLDTDAENHINSLFKENYPKGITEKILKGELLVLPENLYIWATMNTSDQSLFPIDSAFKRRWEWKYIKITNGYQKDDNGQFVKDSAGNKIPLNWKIGVEDSSGNKYDWWLFLQKINAIIASMTSSADKQLGYFFCKADDNGIISEETFVSKVLFYLWNDVFKDYGFEDTSLFRFKDEKGEDQDLTFPDFYNEDGDKVNTERVADFVKNVMIWNKKTEEKD